MTHGREYPAGPGPDGTPAKDLKRQMTLAEARACFRGMLTINAAEIRTPADLWAFYGFPNALDTIAAHLLNQDSGARISRFSPFPHGTEWKDTDSHTTQMLTIRYPLDTSEQVSRTSPQQEIEAFRSRVLPTEIALSTHDRDAGVPFNFTIQFRQKSEDHSEPDTIIFNTKEDNGNTTLILSARRLPIEPKKLRSAAEDFQNVVRILLARDQSLSTGAST